MRRAPALAAALVLACGLLTLRAQAPAGADAFPGRAQDVARGVALYHVTDQALLDPPAPVSVWALRIDPTLADLRPVLANDEIVDTETVPDIGVRYRAIAAVNAGFFLLPSGDPAGIYKLRGQLVSDTRRARGAVGILRGPTPRLIFGRVTATMRLRMTRGGSRGDVRDVDIDGVDTTRLIGKLMLFTPAYHADTDTAAGGTEWVVDGRPLRVVSGPLSGGRTPIPRSGYVLSYGGPRPPPSLAALRKGTRIDLDTRYDPIEGSARDWAAAEDIVGGAGLLLRGGRPVEDWSMERLSAGFPEMRHPRTMIGLHGDGSIWLVTVDGRQPALSFGMSLYELRALATKLGLTDALNLDGGGSTTMWVGGKIVNSPSDVAGPRKVSDALIVKAR